MSRPRSRRNVLQLGGLTAVQLLGGCSLLDTEPQGIALGDILIRNAYSQAHTVRVELSRDGELVREETVTVAGDGGNEILEATWPRTPAVYTLRYAVSGPEVAASALDQMDIRTTTITAADKHAADQTCAIPAVTLLPPNELSVQVGNAETLELDCTRS